jgi:hypothetical protein
MESNSGEATLVATFRDRHAAEVACALLHDAAIASEEPRLGVGGAEGGYCVTVADLRPEVRDRARVILRNAGATDIAGADRARTVPRPVQPGFTDAPPGIVPEAADLPPEEYEEPKGRFADQLDELPEERRKGTS